MIEYINPNDVKDKLDFSLFYKETFILFAVMVAGKSSTSIMYKTNSLVSDIVSDQTPSSLFDFIIDNYSDNNFESLIVLLKKHKTGKYTLLLKFFNDIKRTKINLLNCSLSELESITGIGKKSSRFFMLYNRADYQNVAVLDTHILKFLGKNGIDVPKQTPTAKIYDKLEKDFLAIAAKIKPEITVPELDFLLWFNAKEYNLVPILNKDFNLVF